MTYINVILNIMSVIWVETMYTFMFYPVYRHYVLTLLIYHTKCPYKN